MRLFVALPIAEPARSEVAGLLRRLRSEEWPVRWIHEDGLHLTLKFFGEVAVERLEVIAEALRFAVPGTGPLPLTLGAPGAFPSPRRPRILWLGLVAPPALELLQDRFERSTEAIGFPPEGAPFHPHLTLGRLREGQRLPPDALRRLEAGYQQVPFMADQVVLYESVLGRGAPQYQPRLTLDLGE